MRKATTPAAHAGTNAMDRRTFLKTVGAAAGTLALAPRRSPAIGDDMPDRPNVLVILVDDLGRGDLSCCGAPDLKTPHLDRLAAEGATFSNFYANCTVCSPTRASLLTGRFPDLVGVPGVIRGSPKRYANSFGYFAPDAATLGDLLGKAGYATALVGKWHLGLREPNLPNRRGFDHFHGFLGDMMDDYTTHRRRGQNLMRLDGETIDPRGHATDLFTDWACRYIAGRKGRKQPFFLYLAYNAPHTPIQPPASWLARVRKRDGMGQKRAKLAALIEHLDDGVGKVLAALETAGLARRTLVVFTSDNGGQRSVGARNGPFRGGKTDLYEGGLRVPAMVRWPGRVKPGATIERVALTMDIMPTALAAAGASPPAGIEGESFLPAITGRRQADAGRDLFWVWRQRGVLHAARRGAWKIVRARPGGKLELYNLAEDPKETTDLAATHPARLAELSAALKAHLARAAKVPWRPPR